eukprot:gene34356-57109_t
MAFAEAASLRPGGIRRLYQPALFAAILSALVWWAAWQCQVSWAALRHSFAEGAKIIGFFFPPEWSSLKEMVGPACTTVLLAAVATPLGVALSLLFGLAGAKNI